MSEDIHKWTTGRYTLMFDEHTFFVWDNEKENRMTALQTTERLNEQQATIKHLEDYCGDLEADVKRLMKENKELGKNFDDLVKWSSEIAKRNVVLDEQIGRLQRENEKLKEEEKLYAQEILRLNTLLKQYQSFEDLGGDY